MHDRNQYDSQCDSMHAKLIQIILNMKVILQFLVHTLQNGLLSENLSYDNAC